METDFLPKSTQGTFKVIKAVAIVASVAIGAYLWVESKMSSVAHAAVKSHEVSVKPMLRSMQRDARFTRCALVVHISGDPKTIQKDLIKCSDDDQKYKDEDKQ